MREVKIGAEELILWIRKNSIAESIDNKTLGRKIINLILKELNGRKSESNLPSSWNKSDNSKLPKTSQQYIINSNQLPVLFEAILEW